MSIVAGGYTIHLRCEIDRCRQTCVEFVGENKRNALAAARKEGWWIDTKNDACLCQRHNQSVTRLAKRPNKESK